MIALEAVAVHLDSVSPVEYPRLVEVWEASVRATHSFVTEADIRFYRPLILHDYLKWMQLTCGRGEDNEILGFTGVAHGKLEMLFLHPYACGRSLGKRLLRHAIQQQGGDR